MKAGDTARFVAVPIGAAVYRFVLVGTPTPVASCHRVSACAGTVDNTSRLAQLPDQRISARQSATTSVGSSRSPRHRQMTMMPIDWEYAVGLELSDPGSDYTVVSDSGLVSLLWIVLLGGSGPTADGCSRLPQPAEGAALLARAAG
jgi:hypothetical protein